MKAWSHPDVPTLAPASGDVPARLVVRDTASGDLVEVGPPADSEKAGAARLYVCGITPYDATHMGHAFTYVTFDLLTRVWRDQGCQVTYAQNVTDVDEPLLERAEQTGVDWRDLAQEQTELFRTDMEALRVVPPDHYIGAVESVGLVVNLLESMLLDDSLVADDGTRPIYQVDDPEYPDWYFDVSRSAGFGRVGHLDEQQALAKFTEMGGDPERPGKRNPLDCLVWRLNREGEPTWDGGSLGLGRPGWHIECTAIALEHLGAHFDVQGGGTDLAFPHHEMCAAQAEVATGEPLADAFVHSSMVALDGEKMSKSKGNLELVSRLRNNGADPMAIRLALLDQHYRDDWEWTPELLERANRRLERWRDAVGQDATLGTDDLVAQVRTALRTDLDAPAALAAMDAWAAASLAMDGDDTEGGARAATLVDALLGVRL
ncbi:cysteine--1-D-myo-inosityl 2-amino-2-deoxy-alpha-D-glucopyranoside ligase [Aestuariimicrobium ganziense]|uniref:cysteine--1-D-myo-inosityl 2-amino-2-deoxy-alpha-D-glucopyranoside ligase n=1 Tax=Aestuariimicrobium ganziense TaxID=2773677 RepID=UPI0019431C21|nr:cysteine--1-D-myo-inosityl 2-amino-2-deoxy-alpha-D-glucopyranoside ligase [Aestuariimicrobium ganziense]